MPTSANEVWAALALGALSSVGLLVGMVAGVFSRIPHQRVAIAMSVGAGLLLAGVSLKVTADAIRLAGPIAVALSLLLGAAAFSASNALLARFGAAHRKRCGDCVQQPVESQQPGSGVAIALGNALDAAPEAMVLGMALRDPVVPVALTIAFSLSNLPVALSSTAGMRAAGPAPCGRAYVVRTYADAPGPFGGGRIWGGGVGVREDGRAAWTGSPS